MKRCIYCLFIVIFLLTACDVSGRDSTPTETSLVSTVAPSETSTPTSTETPSEMLTVCTSELPESLFLYDGRQMPSKSNVLAMIQEAPFKQVDGDLTAHGLEKVPSQSDGDLRLAPVTVKLGQLVVDARGLLAVAKPGIRVHPSGCRQMDCAMSWDGETPLEMNQMIVDFRLREGLTWSDGEPVTAEDSRFSYQLASAPEAPGSRWAEERTEAYQPVDARTVQWVGRPGFSTAHLDHFFWAPLPAHLLSDDEEWDELVTDQRLTTTPLSYGPFFITSWDSSAIHLELNPNYNRGDGNILVDTAVTYRVVQGGPQQAWAALQSGDCDLLDASFGLENEPALLAEIQQDERFDVRVATNRDWVQLVFGIQPVPEDNHSAGNDYHTGIFADPITRQAFGACLDREAMLEKTTGGLGTAWPSFLPPDQSQIAPENRIAANPEKGKQLFDHAGWHDHDADPNTPMQAIDGASVPAGTPLSVTLLISASDFHQDLAEIIESSLAACGVGVSVMTLPAEELYAPGPGGPLFGRRFDLALLSWQTAPEPDCRFYSSWQVPSDDNDWIGTNLAGLSDNVYDDACTAAALALPAEYPLALRGAEEAFNSLLPAVPFFAPPHASVYPAPSCTRDDLNWEGDFMGFIEMVVDDNDCP